MISMANPVSFIFSVKVLNDCDTNVFKPVFAMTGVLMNGSY